MPTPWNNWYHCNGNTYGTWLRGDPRGFRERKHRRHVDGDYRNPPAKGTYDRLLAYSKKILKHKPVLLNACQRRIATESMTTKLLDNGIDLIALSVDDRHFHILARFPDRRPRHWVGRAKMHASMVLRYFGLKGQVWARGCRTFPIADRGHQSNVFKYIRTHAEQDAFVWTFRDTVPCLE